MSEGSAIIILLLVIAALVIVGPSLFRWLVSLDRER